MIDSHCHLSDSKFDADLDAVVARALHAGVHSMICIGDSLEESQMGLEIAEKYEQIFCTIGVHPHHASLWEGTKNQEPNTSQLSMIKMLSHGKVVAVGEIGLDYHYMHSPKEIQQKAFREQLLIAKKLQKPAVVHCREAIADIQWIMEEVQPPRVVIHCCTEKWEDVEALVAAGHFLSFTGIATFPASEEIRRTIRMCPIEQLMIETDSPYLAPVPYRGKRNEPAYVVEVAKCVAAEKGIDLREVDRITTENTERFFGLPHS
jgi:TatD DNase family protein